ncbi:hypothetical protein ABC733_03640 [Mangrovibacter sp. SLW1]
MNIAVMKSTKANSVHSVYTHTHIAYQIQAEMEGQRLAGVAFIGFLLCYVWIFAVFEKYEALQ